MTDRRDFKRRVRDRQAETGESYMEASRHVAGTVPTKSSMAVVDMTDISDVAHQLGFACQASAQDEVLALVPAVTLLRRLQQVLLLPEESDLDAMRSIVFRGDIAPIAEEDEIRNFGKLKAFIARAQAGVAGMFGGGRIIVLHELLPLVYLAWPMMKLPNIPTRPARVVVMTLDAFRLHRGTL